MTLEAGLRLFIDRGDLHRTQAAPDPDGPAQRPLQPGQARLAVDSFQRCLKPDPGTADTR